MTKVFENTRGPSKVLVAAGELFAKVMDSEVAHTSFGKLPLASEKTSPQFCTLSSAQHSLRNW